MSLGFLKLSQIYTILEILKILDKEFIPMCLKVAQNVQIAFELKKEIALEIAHHLITYFLDVQRARWNGFLKYINFEPRLSSKEIDELVKSLGGSE